MPSRLVYKYRQHQSESYVESCIQYGDSAIRHFVSGYSEQQRRDDDASDDDDGRRDGSLRPRLLGDGDETKIITVPFLSVKKNALAYHIACQKRTG